MAEAVMVVGVDEGADVAAEKLGCGAAVAEVMVLPEVMVA